MVKKTAALQSELARIQQGLHVPKNLRNTFGKYNYRNFEGICEAVKPLLGDCLLTVSDELVNIGERYYIRADVTLTLGEESITVSGYARETESKKGMDESQITGTASSYSRKYAASGIFLIDDTKDADSDEYAKQTAGKKPATKKAAPTDIEPEDTKATKEEVLGKINDAKATPHLTNLYNKYEAQARDEGWVDDLIGNCSRVKAAIQMAVHNG